MFFERNVKNKGQRKKEKNPSAFLNRAPKKILSKRRKKSLKSRIVFFS